jgi:hypothetical protein
MQTQIEFKSTDDSQGIIVSTNNFSKKMMLASLFLMLTPITHLGAKATVKDMRDGVEDAFNQAKIIVQALQDLEAPPVSVLPELPKTKKQKLNGIQAYQNLPALTPQTTGLRRLGPFKRTTVFANFDLTVEELTETSFRVSVVASDFCEEIQVKEASTRIILAKHNLDDERAFSIEVRGHRLDQNLSLSIAVLKEGSLNYAFVPLLDSPGTNFGHEP